MLFPLRFSVSCSLFDFLPLSRVITCYNTVLPVLFEYSVPDNVVRAGCPRGFLFLDVNSVFNVPHVLQYRFSRLFVCVVEVLILVSVVYLYVPGTVVPVRAGFPRGLLFLDLNLVILLKYLVPRTVVRAGCPRGFVFGDFNSVVQRTTCCFTG